MLKKQHLGCDAPKRWSKYTINLLFKREANLQKIQKLNGLTSKTTETIMSVTSLRDGEKQILSTSKTSSISIKGNCRLSEKTST